MRLDKAAAEIERLDFAKRRYGRLEMVRSFQIAPGFPPKEPAVLEAEIAAARERAGQYGRVEVINWGPRWELARAALEYVMQFEDDTDPADI